MLSQIKQIIKAHTEKAQSSDPDKPQGPCPRCLAKNSCFKLHERRFRFFRFVVESFVQTVESFLLQWKCPLCKRTFTDYPEFAEPHKQYVKSTIKQFSAEYLQEGKEKKSYRGVVTAANSQPLYYKEDDITPNDMALSHTSVWNWIGSLGLAESRAPTPAGTPGESRTFDWLWLCKAIPVAPHKYRSVERLHLLQKAKLLLKVTAELKDYLFFSNFQRFETGFS